MNYIDGFLLPLPTANLEAYRKMAETAAAVWMEHGALAYVEAAADDTDSKEMLAFPAIIGATADQTTIFAYIVFKSREHRDEVNAKVMADPRLQDACSPETAPFDYKRMAYGGFRAIVQR